MKGSAATEPASVKAPGERTRAHPTRKRRTRVAMNTTSRALEEVVESAGTGDQRGRPAVAALQLRQDRSMAVEDR